MEHRLYPAKGCVALESLTVQKHPLIEGPITLNFSESHTLILGKNGTGKTTLLNLIAMICRGSFEELRSVSGPVDFTYSLCSFQDSVTDRGAGFLRMKARLRILPEERKPSETAMRHLGIQRGVSGLDPSQSPPPMSWIFDVDLSFEANGGAEEPKAADKDAHLIAMTLFQGVGEYSESGRVDVRRVGSDISSDLSPFSSRFIVSVVVDLIDWNPSGETQKSPSISWVSNCLFQLHAHSVRGVIRFDEGLDFYRDLLPSPQAETPTTAGFKSYHPGLLEGSNIPVSLLNQISAVEEGETYIFSNVPELLRVAELYGAERIVAKPMLIEQRSPEEFEYRGFNFEIHWKNGSVHSHRLLSFGQKRLLAFQWMLGVNPAAPVILDELANGLHNEWVAACLEDTKPRQVFHAVQNPLVVDLLAHLPEETLRHSMVLCRRTPEERFGWRNPSEEEVSRIRRALNAGLQQISEILMQQGLW